MLFIGLLHAVSGWEHTVSLFSIIHDFKFAEYLNETGIEAAIAAGSQNEKRMSHTSENNKKINQLHLERACQKVQTIKKVPATKI
jgi:hypothetical protein